MLTRILGSATSCTYVIHHRHWSNLYKQVREYRGGMPLQRQQPTGQKIRAISDGFLEEQRQGTAEVVVEAGNRRVVAEVAGTHGSQGEDEALVRIQTAKSVVVRDHCRHCQQHVFRHHSVIYSLSNGTERPY